MPLYEYRCEACQQRFEVIQEVLGSRTGSVHALWKGPGAATHVFTRDSVQGIGLVHHRLLAEGEERQRVDRHVECDADAKPATGDSATTSTKSDTAAPAAKPAASE